MTDDDPEHLADRLETLELINDQLAIGDQLGRRFSSSLIGAFEAVAARGKGLGDVMRGLTLQLSRLVLQAAFRPLESAIGQGLGGLVSGSLGFAKGAALQHGVPVPFAKGGVVASPVTFPLGGGGIGLAGEAGAEAILPLARGSDGRLGVAARGGGANITVNITTPDVDGFRRSQTQVAAMLARAMASGERNL